ncbi:MAG: MogA/MoaB family molybdenum cofactor biosynthesis protein [Tepidisphaeraceae bacterium]|jgi:molybdenum cofactor biosynthesis protein B
MSYSEHCGEAKDIKARCAVVTLSDTRTPGTDTSGRKICDLLKGAGHTIGDYQVIPDEPRGLQLTLETLVGRRDLDLIVSNGGTGVSRRDRTIPVVQMMLEIELPGFGELFRMLSWQEIGSGALLSRATGGVAGGKLLFALPGSTAAVELAVTRLILPEIGHLLHQLRK